MFKFLRNCQTVFHSGCCMILHPCQQRTTVPFLLHPHQHCYCLIFLIVAMKMDMNWSQAVFLTSLKSLYNVLLLVHLLNFSSVIKYATCGHFLELFFFSSSVICCCNFRSVLYNEIFKGLCLPLSVFPIFFFCLTRNEAPREQTSYIN